MRTEPRPDRACGMSPLTGEHTWSVDGETVECRHCHLRTPLDVKVRMLEMAKKNKAAQLSGAIRRDSDAFKQMSKRRAS